jgi:hypothetical protein
MAPIHSRAQRGLFERCYQRPDATFALAMSCTAQALAEAHPAGCTKDDLVLWAFAAAKARGGSLKRDQVHKAIRSMLKGKDIVFDGTRFRIRGIP